MSHLLPPDPPAASQSWQHSPASRANLAAVIGPMYVIPRSASTPQVGVPGSAPRDPDDATGQPKEFIQWVHHVSTGTDSVNTIPLAWWRPHARRQQRLHHDRAKVLAVLRRRPTEAQRAAVHRGVAEQQALRRRRREGMELVGGGAGE